jgi:hypothetical protein
LSLAPQTKRDIIRRTWNLEATGCVPYTIEIGEPHFATRAYFADDVAELAWHANYHERRKGVNDFDLPNIKPNLGIGTIAAAFGCGLRINDEADPWIDALIGADCQSKVYDLARPDPQNNPVFKRVRERIRSLQQGGGMPLRLVNVASPLVTASMIWDYTDFIMALLTNPQAVHHLLDLVTRATIDYVNLQLDTIADLHSMGHEVLPVPREVGLRISDDTAALLSPQLYREFGLPYNARLAEAFGGVVVHSCGDCKHVIPAMLETPGLRGLDLTMPQNTDWTPLEKAAGRVVLGLRHYYWDHPDPAVSVDALAYTRRLIERFGTTGVFIVTSTPTVEQACDLGEKLGRLLSAV